MLQLDEATRTIYFVGVGKESGRDPYFQHYYSVKFDGKDLKLLTPENADHAMTIHRMGPTLPMCIRRRPSRRPR